MLLVTILVQEKQTCWRRKSKSSNSTQPLQCEPFNPLSHLLGWAVQSTLSENSRRLSFSVLVEDDISVVFDEAALSERAIESSECILSLLVSKRPFEYV